MANPAPTPGTNTFTPKKSTNKAPGDFQRARTALTQQESAEISRFLAIVEQERAQDTKTRVTYACKPPTKQDLPKWVAPILFPTQTAPPTTSKPPNPKRQ
ncbi:hypothetical protein MHU86_9053 [Fragilaria crotonensis]|nr:hypothetical protein MHU86_9053 [Fragilaria crotonensis]